MLSNVVRISEFVDLNKTTVYCTGPCTHVVYVVACGGKTRSRGYRLLSRVKIALDITNFRQDVTTALSGTPNRYQTYLIVPIKPKKQGKNFRTKDQNPKKPSCESPGLNEGAFASHFSRPRPHSTLMETRTGAHHSWPEPSFDSCMIKNSFRATVNIYLISNNQNSALNLFPRMLQWGHMNSAPTQS